MASLQKITPFLWFDGKAEQAAHFYASIFPGSKVTSITRYPEGSPMPAGTAMVASFELCGQPFAGMNAGPGYPFTWAVSFVVHCEGQAEIDHYWAALQAGGGSPSQCGWLQDQFGLAWQIMPANMGTLMSNASGPTAARRMAAMLRMTKIIIADLEAA